MQQNETPNLAWKIQKLEINLRYLIISIQLLEYVIQAESEHVYLSHLFWLAFDWYFYFIYFIYLISHLIENDPKVRSCLVNTSWFEGGICLSFRWRFRPSNQTTSHASFIRRLYRGGRGITLYDALQFYLLVNVLLYDETSWLVSNSSVINVMKNFIAISDFPALSNFPL